MMIGATMMIAGLVLMVPWPIRPVHVDFAAGDNLREAFKGPMGQPVPRDMRELAARIAGPLRVIPGDKR